MAGFYYLYQYLGWVFLVGLAVFLCGFLSNLCLTRKNARLQKSYMLCQEKRLTLVQEILQNIKTLKTFSLLEVFEQKVKEKREEELQ